MKFGSLFSGIGGFDLGFERAGMECAWQVEIDSHCQKLLREKFSNTEKFTDVKNVGRNNLAPVDLLCGGFPCQDLSVAGRRAGLAGERSGLWFEFHRVISEMRPRWVVIENVPGLLSSNAGRDFAIVLSGLVECGYRVAWRILDAQFFGVPQRRRRVFIVGCLGSGRAAEILFESESVSRDIAPSRKARTETPAYAVRRAQTGSNGWGIREDETGTLDQSGGDARIASPLTRGSATGRGVNQPGRRREDDENIVIAGTLAASRGGLDRPAGNANETDFCIPVGFDLAQITSDKNYSNPKEGDPQPPLNTAGQGMIAQPLRAGRQFSDMGDGQSNVVIAEPLTVSYAKNRGANAGNNPKVHNLIAFDYQLQGSERTFIHRKNEQAQMIAGRPDAISWHENKGGELSEGETAKALRSGASHSYQGVGVRRLTPTECERLQGFPDGWTEGFSDSVRYRMLGNAVCINVAEWIGERIIATENA